MACAQEEAPEMAVVDLRMPGCSGLVRDLVGLDEGVRLGAAGYLAKPADADDILEAFARAQQPPLVGSQSTHLVSGRPRAGRPHQHWPEGPWC